MTTMNYEVFEHDDNENGKLLFWSSKKIRKHKADYNIVIGKRSNGKTYDVLYNALKEYIQTGKQLAVIRRMKEDFVGKRGPEMMKNLTCNGENVNSVEVLSHGAYNTIVYKSSRWYLGKYDEKSDKIISSEIPFAYAFALTDYIHDKSTSYPQVSTILFDEFLTDTGYLPREWSLFQNTVSTIVRYRGDVVIWMLGNTVNDYCPYFNEMGITHLDTMKPGTIRTYRYMKDITLANGKTTTIECKIAVERCSSTRKSVEESRKYFLFDSPSTKMITDGEWQFDLYPHCPYRYKEKDIIFSYFIVFDTVTAQCDIVETANGYFTYIHRKTTPIKYPDTDIIFSPTYDYRRNWYRKITKPVDALSERIASFFLKEKVFYQDNSLGNTIKNYLDWCRK